MSTKKLTCVVTRRGFVVNVSAKKGERGKGRELAIGTEVDLTERQIKSFIGKVRLKSELEQAKSSGAGLTPGDISRLIKRNAELEDGPDVEALQAQAEALAKDNQELRAQVEALAKAAKPKSKA